MPKPTPAQRPEVGRLTPGVAVGVRQVREAVTLHAHAWIALGLVGALLFGLKAFGEGTPPDGRTRFVEVRAAGRLLSEKAALVDDPEYGLVLRLRDLNEKLPPDLPKLVPAQIYGDLFLPILPILVKHVVLDQEPGVLEFVGVSYPERPSRLTIGDRGRDLSSNLPPRPLPVAMAPALALGDGGLASDLIGLDAPIALHQVAGAIKGDADLDAAASGPTPLGAVMPSAEGWEVAPAAEPPGREVAQLIPIASPGAAIAGVIAGGGGKAADGDIRRRDPFDLPLLQSEEWLESLTSVILNGETVTEGAFAIQGPDGQWALRVVDLRDWRVILDEDRILTFNGEPFYEVSKLDGVRSEFDDRTLTLNITLPASGFESTALESARRSTLPPQSGRGAFPGLRRLVPDRGRHPGTSGCAPGTRRVQRARRPGQRLPPRRHYRGCGACPPRNHAHQGFSRQAGNGPPRRFGHILPARSAAPSASAACSSPAISRPTPISSPSRCPPSAASPNRTR